MLVVSHSVIDQLCTSLFEVGSDLAVYECDGENCQGHQDKRQERSGAAVRKEHGVPVSNERKDGAGCNGKNGNQLQAFIQTALLIFSHNTFPPYSFLLSKLLICE